MRHRRRGRRNGAEDVGVGIALVLRLARAGSLLRPLVDEAVLLPDPHLVLDPDLDRRAGRLSAYDLAEAEGKVFLCAAMASGSCAGCLGLALTWA